MIKDHQEHNSGMYPASRSDALRRAEEFITTAAVRYGAHRNTVLFGHPNVSRLSPAVTHRLITEQEFSAMTLRQHKFSMVEKLIQEIHWRTYWKGWLELRPWVWHHYLAGLERLQNDATTSTIEQCQAIETGHSGIALVDEWMRELRETGYLHNHVRMWFAGFWIHTRRLPWQLGANLFQKYLLDFDAASNTLSWRWVAGLQTRGKCYLPRVENIRRYDMRAREEKFSRGLEKIEAQEAAPLEQEPFSLEPKPFKTNEHPPPQVDLIVIHHEHLSALETIYATTQTKEVLLLEEDPCRSSSPRADWRTKALDDTYQRVIKSRAEDRQRASVTRLAVNKLAEYIIATKARNITMVRPATGPLSDSLTVVFEKLKSQDVQVHLVTPGWDAELWPLATRGYFSFWENIRRKYSQRF